MTDGNHEFSQSVRRVAVANQSRPLCQVQVVILVLAPAYIISLTGLDQELVIYTVINKRHVKFRWCTLGITDVSILLYSVVICHPFPAFYSVFVMGHGLKERAQNLVDMMSSPISCESFLSLQSNVFAIKKLKTANGLPSAEKYWSRLAPFSIWRHCRWQRVVACQNRWHRRWNELLRGAAPA